MCRTMKKLVRLSGVIETGLHSVAGIFMLLMFVMISIDVFARYFFHRSFDLVLVFAPWFMVWIVYFMIGILTKHRQHIAVDTLPSKIPERPRTALFLLFDIISFIFAALLCWTGIQYVQLVRDAGIISITLFAVPTWIGVVCVPLGGIFLAFFSIEWLVTDVLSLSRFRRTEE